MSSVIDNLKDVAKLVQDVGNLDLYRQIVGLQTEIMRIVDDNVNLKSELRQLREQFELQNSLVFKSNFYWRQRPEGEDGPYCSSCWDEHEHHLVRFHNLGVMNGAQLWGCTSCGVVLSNEGSHVTGAMVDRFHEAYGLRKFAHRSK